MAVNPEAKLSDLKAKLQEREAEMGRLVKSKESLRTEVAALEKVVREIDQFSNSYNHALPNVEKSIQDMGDYIQTRLPEIEAAAGDKKGAVNGKIEELDSRIKKVQKEQRTLEEKVEKSKNEYEAAKQDYLTRQTEFESVKAVRKTIEDKLNDIRALKASIEKEEKGEGETNTANMYFLIKELDRQLSAVKPEIKSADEYKALLLNAWQELASAQAAVKKKEEQMNEAKEKYDVKKREWESLQQSRRKTILAELTNI
jgi:chromosome segregation ATPase